MIQVVHVLWYKEQKSMLAVALLGEKMLAVLQTVRRVARDCVPKRTNQPTRAAQLTTRSIGSI